MPVFSFILYSFFRFALSLRYRIRVEGLEQLKKQLNQQKSGALFLANHPAKIDPCILLFILWPLFKPHPVAMESLFRIPIVRSLLNFLGALPVPNFDYSANSYKRKQIAKTYEKIFSYLDQGENLLIYPAGGLKKDAEERLGGASGVHRLLAEKPDVPIVLVRTTGLWGSQFSRALTGCSPDLGITFLKGLKILLLNGIFFAPRRKVLIEWQLASPSLPRHSDKLTLNRYLENWYNAPGPEPLSLISYHFLWPLYPDLPHAMPRPTTALQKEIPQAIKNQVDEELAKFTKLPLSEWRPEMHLALDFGLDSLDLAQLAFTISERFSVSHLHNSDLTTLESLYGIATHLTLPQKESEQPPKSPSNLHKGKWLEEKIRPPLLYPQGESLQEVFFKTCQRLKKRAACVDLTMGELSYTELQRAVLLFAEILSHLPYGRIGIMLPASIAVNILILATQAAGKVPVMVNWTLGERTLQAICAQAELHCTLTSWSFMEQVDSIELDGLDEQLLFIEDLVSKASVFDKLRALFRSWYSPKKLTHLFGPPHKWAVILFTSGTESMPKGVPLTHQNILSNQRGALQRVCLQADAILLGTLPPFHSFGFSVTGLFPLLAGVRVAYSPQPTEGKQVAQAIARWRATLLCLAPTFLKTLLRAATAEQLQTLQLVVTGAEKTSHELYQKLRELNPHAKLIEGYGITECAPIIALNSLEEAQEDVQGVGAALPGVQLEIVHPETYEPLATEKAGLILVQGSNVFEGYLNPSLTSPFIEHAGKRWYQTGDLGYLDRQKRLVLSGRLKRFVKIGGEMISLASIEALFQEAELFSDSGESPAFALVSLEREGKKSELHLFTTFNLSLEQANQLLRKKGMSNLIKMSSVTQLPAIPLLATGKIDYRALQKKL